MFTSHVFGPMRAGCALGYGRDTFPLDRLDPAVSGGRIKERLDRSKAVSLFYLA